MGSEMCIRDSVWGVLPTNDGVLVSRSGRVTIPDNVKDALKRAAEQSGGEPVSKIGNLRYEHDLDARDTTIVRHRPHGQTVSAAAARPERVAHHNGTGTPRGYRAAMKHLQALEKPRGGGRRRGSRNRAGEKKASYALPQIVITHDPAGMSPGSF